MSESSRGKEFGIALDVGTTVIKGAIFDMSSGKELAAAGVPNEQKAFGQDVLTRLHLATKDGGMKELNKRAISAVNALLKQLTGRASVDKRRISRIIAVGNSAMYHLMLMIDPASLARAPFLPAEKVSQERSAARMGLNTGKNTVFKFMPNVSGFVGSDILASILVTGLHRGDEPGLIMDIGTNGEIALGSKKKMFAASCASGPAFEGRHIRCGMPAVDGAIIRASFKDKKFYFDTVGNSVPRGIGGSGLMDIVSILIGERVIDRNGRMEQGDFVISESAGKKICITQKDIREVQLAKAALSAGVKILSDKAGVALEDLKKFYITGTFGKEIDKKSAFNIGLVPGEVPFGSVEFLEDGALSGAKKILLNASLEGEVGEIAVKCEHVELHKDKSFEEAFAAAMHF